jgi:hypothetical protein
MNTTSLALIFTHMIKLNHLVKGKVASIKALMDTLRKEALVRVTCLELKSYLFKALVLPTFTHGIEIWGGNLENSYWKVFEKGMKMHMMSHVEVCSLTT